jgi:hypothetical protein
MHTATDIHKKGCFWQLAFTSGENSFHKTMEEAQIYAMEKLCESGTIGVRSFIMPIITEQQAIAKVNNIINQSSLGPEFRVYSVQAGRFGWICYWNPPGKEKVLTYASPYLVHREGRVMEWNDVAARHRLNPKDTKQVINAFVRECETKIRQ